MKILHRIQNYQQHLYKYGFVLCTNLFFSGLFLWIGLYIKIARINDAPDQQQRLQMLEGLFEEPFTKQTPYLGLFTSFSELLWCVSVTICFSCFALLKKLKQDHHMASQFILQTGLLLSLLLIDDIGRVSLILKATIDLPKAFMYLIYSLWGIYIAVRFRRYITQATPYILVLISIVLFVISGTVDSINLPGQGSLILLEDGTKLLGLLNITAYVWFVCKSRVSHTLESLSSNATR